MPAQLIERALAEWREAERLLQGLPGLDPDRETVRDAVIRLRETYQRLSELGPDSKEQLADCQDSIEQVHAALDAVRRRTDVSAQNGALGARGVDYG